MIFILCAFASWREISELLELLERIERLERLERASSRCGDEGRPDSVTPVMSADLLQIFAVNY
jgi:hypothetical protein